MLSQLIGLVHDPSNSHYLRVNKERRSIFLLMAQTYQVGYENMENYDFGDFRPPHPSGGVNFSQKQPKNHILNIKISITIWKNYHGHFFISFSGTKIWYETMLIFSEFSFFRVIAVFTCFSRKKIIFVKTRDYGYVRWPIPGHFYFSSLPIGSAEIMKGTEIFKK